MPRECRENAQLYYTVGTYTIDWIRVMGLENRIEEGRIWWRKGSILFHGLECLD